MTETREYDGEEIDPQEVANFNEVSVFRVDEDVEWGSGVVQERWDPEPGCREYWQQADPAEKKYWTPEQIERLRESPLDPDNRPPACVQRAVALDSEETAREALEKIRPYEGRLDLSQEKAILRGILE